jgi:hypothetical protein
MPGPTPKFYPNPIQIVRYDQTASVCMIATVSMVFVSCVIEFKGSDGSGLLVFASIPALIMVIQVVTLSIFHRKAVRVIGRVLKMGSNSLSGVRGGISNWNELNYAYSYKDKSYSDTRSVTTNVEFEAGQKITIAVDPDNPSKSDVLDIYA